MHTTAQGGAEAGGQRAQRALGGYRGLLVRAYEGAHRAAQPRNPGGGADTNGNKKGRASIEARPPS